MFNERLKKAIKRSGKNQKDVAAALGISYAAISRYVNSERKHLAEKTIIGLCKVLGVTPNYLFGFEDEEEPDNPWCRIEE